MWDFYIMNKKQKDILTWEMLESENTINRIDFFNCSDLVHRNKLSSTNPFCSFSAYLWKNRQLKDEKGKKITDECILQSHALFLD